MLRSKDSFLSSSELVDIAHLRDTLSERSANDRVLNFLNLSKCKGTFSDEMLIVAINAVYQFVLHIPYRYMHPHTKASEVLIANMGMCTNKTTLFVALARLLQIPAGFHVLKYRKQPHKRSLNKIISLFEQIGNITTHVFPVVWFHNRWVNIDCTDDPIYAEIVHNYSPPTDWIGQDIWNVDLHLIESNLGIWPEIEEFTIHQTQWSDNDFQKMNKAIEQLLEQAERTGGNEPETQSYD